MKKAVPILSVLLLVLGTGFVMANPVLLEYVNVSPSQNVNITTGPPANYSGQAEAGVYNLLIDFNPSDGVDNYQNFSGYCVDPAFSEPNPEFYDIVAIPTPTDPNDSYALGLQAAAWIFASYGTPSLAADAANVQSAIWIVVDGITVNSPSTTAQAYAAAAAAAVAGGWTAPGWISLAAHPAASGGITTSVANGEDFQDYIIRTPEPGSILLLGLGLFGVGVLSRRKFS